MLNIKSKETIISKQIRIISRDKEPRKEPITMKILELKGTISEINGNNNSNCSSSSNTEFA